MTDKNYKVFGLGLSKTGTSSLGDALNYLGINTIHYPFDDDTYAELYRGNYDLSILKETYRGIVDIPAAPFYAQWDRQYPGSKFILTVRDRDAWIESAEKHWELMMHWWKERPQFQRFQEFISAVVYGSVGFNAGRFLFAYDMQIKNVLDYFKNRPDDLLVMDICAGEGWEKLCPFLGLPEPAAPFPHANEWMHKLIQATAEMRAFIPPDSTYILIDHEGFGEHFSAGYRRIPFLEKAGQYWGLPADDNSAIEAFERLLQTQKPSFLIVGWPAFWWEGHYRKFFGRIQHSYACRLNNERLKIYDLRV
jgi:Sulfotransferase domain